MESLRVIAVIWPNILLGTVLLLLSTVAGWSLAAEPRRLAVRVITWWVETIVLPLIRARSWWSRCATIFVNNALVLTALLALGWWRAAPLFGVVVLGLSLGMGVRVLTVRTNGLVVSTFKSSNEQRRRMRVGMTLNMFEPPAILVTVGLSLGQQSVPLETFLVWQTFLLLVMPATAIAAGGEALWLGTCRPRDEENNWPIQNTEQEPVDDSNKSN